MDFNEEPVLDLERWECWGGSIQVEVQGQRHWGREECRAGLIRVSRAYCWV